MNPINKTQALPPPSLLHFPFLPFYRLPTSSPLMGSPDLKLQLLTYITSLFQKGILTEQFHQVEILSDSHNSGFRTQFINTFFDGTEKLFSHVDDILNENNVEFSKLYHAAKKIRGSSSMIGACGMQHAVLPLIQCCKANDKDGCMEALQGLKHEFQQIRAKLEIIVQLEEIIRHNEQD